MKTRLPRFSQVTWHGREAFVLANDLVYLVTLTGGGHIVDFRLREKSGLPVLNPLWVRPWKTIEPYRYRPRQHSALYGSTATGRMLCRASQVTICAWIFSVRLPRRRPGKDFRFTVKRRASDGIWLAPVCAGERFG